MTKTLHLHDNLRQTIVLPASKSLSNRALLLCAMSGNGSQCLRPSDCDDTLVMQRALNNRPYTIDIMAAGTAMRFLTAYFAATPGEEHVLTGTPRMLERPIGVLVEALRQLGADIRYEGHEGFPPLHISGKRLRGGTLRLPASVSSQYVSALLMTAPLMEEGLRLQLEGEIVSRPYIDMTLSLMKQFGAKAAWTSATEVIVEPSPYTDGVTYTVESDWSAASYWYELMALSRDEQACIVLPYLTPNSLQGDSAVSTYFAPLGVATRFEEVDGQPAAVLTRNAAQALPEGEVLELDLVDQPDLAQTFVVTCAMLRRPFRFTGLRSLRIKETDRISALQNELKKFGIDLEATTDCELHIFNYADHAPRYDGTPIATYNDHRMAMAFAPAALRCEGVSIADPEVVSKSYPHFWEDLQCLY